MNTITEAAERLLERHQAFVLATIVSRQGSTPRTAGTRMIIADDGRTDGTIGGGALEARVIQKAVAMLSSRHLDPHSDPHPERIAFDMTESELGGMDMICGGRLEVLLEFIEAGTPAAVVFQRWREIQSGAEPCLFLTVLRFAGEQLAGVDHCLLKNRRVVYGDPQLDPAILETLAREHADAVSRRSVALGESLILIEPVLPAEVLFLFGAGHVGQATARLAAFVGFRVQVIDDRDAYANAERFPEAEQIRVVENFASAFEGLPVDGSAFIVIATRGHLHDMTVLSQALRTNAAYIGMIGSRRKRDRIFTALLEQGFTDADLKRVHSPIGIDIEAETPAEIAVSIGAELIQVRAERAGSIRR